MSSISFSPVDTGEVQISWPVETVVASERRLLDAGVDLMAVASWGLARHCAAELGRVRGRVSGAHAVLLVGAGNNGGDALFAGVALRRRGVAVTAVLVADRAHPDGLDALRRAGGRVVQLDDDPDSVAAGRDLIGRADLVVDAILGIGSRGAVRGRAAGLLVRPSGRELSVVACDLPSGVDPDTGAVTEAVLAADVTVTFGVAKPGLLLPPADALCGEVRVVDLGLVSEDDGSGRVDRWESADAAAVWPWPARSAHKYSRGVVGVVAGSLTYPGAGVLACSAAVAAGAGMVRFAGDPRIATEILRASPEVVTQSLPRAGRVQTWLVGSGSDPEDPVSVDLIEQVIHRLVADPSLTAVVDAGALIPVARAAMSGRITNPDRLLLTPHAGELAALLTGLGSPEDPVQRPDVECEPVRLLRRAIALSGATIMLKGPTTIVADATGRMITTAGGPPWLAGAGSGDVLAGIAAAVMAAGVAPIEAGAAAALVHAGAGHLVSGDDENRGGPVRAGALVGAIGSAIGTLSYA